MLAHLAQVVQSSGPFEVKANFLLHAPHVVEHNTLFAPADKPSTRVSSSFAISGSKTPLVSDPVGPFGSALLKFLLPFPAVAGPIEEEAAGAAADEEAAPAEAISSWYRETSSRLSFGVMRRQVSASCTEGGRLVPL